METFEEDISPDYLIPILSHIAGQTIVKGYPMDMEEFIITLGEETLVEKIKECFREDAPMPSALHDAAIQLYRQYLLVGGMVDFIRHCQSGLQGRASKETSGKLQRY